MNPLRGKRSEYKLAYLCRIFMVLLIEGYNLHCVELLNSMINSLANKVLGIKSLSTTNSFFLSQINALTKIIPRRGFIDFNRNIRREVCSYQFNYPIQIKNIFTKY